MLQCLVFLCSKAGVLPVGIFTYSLHQYCETILCQTIICCSHYTATYLYSCVPQFIETATEYYTDLNLVVFSVQCTWSFAMKLYHRKTQEIN